MLNDTRIRGADGMRALACLMVMAHHAFQRVSPNNDLPGFADLQLFMLTGAAGVSVFFVLSGFLLAGPFWKAYFEGQKLPSLGTYALRRWARIAPAFWLNITVAFLLVSSFQGVDEQKWFRFLSGLTFTSSHSYVTLFPVNLNGPLWSIGFEVFSYVCLPIFMTLLFFLPFRRSATTALVFWLAALALVLTANGLIQVYGQPGNDERGWQFGMVGGAKYWWPQYNPIGFFAQFALGIVAAGFVRAIARARNQKTKPEHFGFDLAALALLVGTAAFLWFVRTEGDFAVSFQRQPYYYPFFPLAIAATLVVLPFSVVLGKIVDNPVAKFIATISFGLYMWHYLLIEVTSFAFAKDLVYMGVQDPLRWLTIISTVYLVSAAIATASWIWFEKPIVEWSQRKRASSAG